MKLKKGNCKAQKPVFVHFTKQLISHKQAGKHNYGQQHQVNVGNLSVCSYFTSCIMQAECVKIV